MKATVVIPTYKRSHRLAALLECLARQDGDGLAQVIVCDDGSPDDTRDVAQSFAAKLPLVYRFQDDLGFRAGQARNMGIASATGDVLIFVDDDVVVTRDFVSSHLEAHRNGTSPKVVIGFRHRTHDAGHELPELGEIEKLEPDDRIAVLGMNGDGLPTHENPWLFVYSCNFSVTRSAPELSFDEKFVGWGLEDTDIGYRLHRAGVPIVCAPRARVLHIEDPAPRDPFRCEERALTPSYDTYVRNAVYFMDKHREDTAVRDWVCKDLRWYIRDPETGSFVKNGFANDVSSVIEHSRAMFRELGAENA
ncbi:MAG: glycosyltransferase [Sandaracinaceae bacterium]|nr:glycosyltransferase [Sandaracinaceae bacterium]